MPNMKQYISLMLDSDVLKETGFKINFRGYLHRRVHVSEAVVCVMETLNPDEAEAAPVGLWST